MPVLGGAESEAPGTSEPTRFGGRDDGARGAPHSPQNFCAPGFMAPQELHRTAAAWATRMRVDVSICASASASASENSSALLKRCDGVFASAIMQTSASAWGILRSGAASRGSSACSVRCRSTTCVGLSPSNGSLLVSSWYITTPTA